MSVPDRDEASGVETDSCSASRSLLSVIKKFSSNHPPSKRRRSMDRLKDFEVPLEQQSPSSYTGSYHSYESWDDTEEAESARPRETRPPPAASREHEVSLTEAETSQSDPKLETGQSKDSPTAFQPEDSPCCGRFPWPEMVRPPPAASREHEVSLTEAETSQADPKLETGQSKDSPTAFQPEDSPITPKTKEYPNQNAPPSVKRQDEVSDEPDCTRRNCCNLL